MKEDILGKHTLSLCLVPVPREADVPFHDVFLKYSAQQISIV